MKANDAKTRFLAATSHDLRQPLSALSLYIGVLKSQVPPDCGALVEKMQECANSLSELLTNLLDMNKLDAGVVTPNLTDFSVDDLLASLVSVFSLETQQKGLRLHAPRSGVYAKTDRKLLQRILGFVGISPVNETLIGIVGDMDAKKLQKYQSRMKKIGEKGE